MDKKNLLAELKNYSFPEHIIKAFKNIKREDFIPSQYKIFAYDDNALPIAQGQTISQPYTIAFMLNLLDLDSIKGKKCNILEIGSGSGYVLALLSSILKKANIYGLEINSELAKSSSNLLSNKKRIKIINQSGEKGYAESEPYERILISASLEDFNSLEPIIQQLSLNGILVSPVKHSIVQIKKEKEGISKKEFYGFSFVPFIKKEKLT